MVYHSSRTISLLLIGLLLTSSVTSFWLIHWKKGMYAASSIAFGVNVDMTAMIPGTPYTIQTAQNHDFFDLAVHLHINTIRITDIHWETTGEEYAQSLWQQVFDQAAQHHIRIILLLEDGGDHSAIQQAHTLLGSYGLAHARSLWLVDLYNEPDISDPRRMTALREEASYVQQVAPGVPVTIGGWKSAIQHQPDTFDWENPADIPRFIHLVNIVSPHLYTFEDAAKLGRSPRRLTEQFLDAVRKESSHKPILLEEFGASNGLAPTNQPASVGSLTWQASVYRGVLQAVSAEYTQGVMGAIAWIIAPRPGVSNPGLTNFEGDMTGWALILNHGKRLLPAAQEFSIVAREKP
ncbi:MAG: hypothetical protein H0W02_12315 [Ktedonobacteraceae bacterium]|nr:hypothetical protein [Ktedonobacteraceae bacterium]